MSPRTPHRFALSIAAAAVVLAAAFAPSAAAAPGATGYFDSATWSGTTLTMTGWAYNGRTVPVQEVQLVLRDSNNQQIHDRVATIAGGYRPDVVAAGAANTPFVGFRLVLPTTAAMKTKIKTICAYTHDRGEAGGLVYLGCKRP